MVPAGTSIFDFVLHGLAGLAALVALFLLPGMAWLSRRLPAGTPAIERWALQAGVGFWATVSGTAALFFLPVEVAGFRIADGAAVLPFVAAAAVGLAGAWTSRSRPVVPQPAATPMEKAALGLAVAAFLLFFLGLEAEYTAPTCLYRAILRLLDPTHFLDNPDAPILLLGIISTEQLGGVFAAFTLASFSQVASLRLLNGVFAGLLFLGVAALGRRLAGRTWAGLLAACLLVATGDVWLSEIGNVNMIAAQVAVLFLLLLHPDYRLLPRTRAFAFGMLVLSRYVAVVGGLALLHATWRDTRGQPAGRRAAALASDALVVLLVTLPMHVYHLANTGSPLAYMGMQEYPSQGYEVLGIEFTLRAMLNAPLYDTLVRTPFNPFPMWIGWPLHLVQQWGILGLALAAGGFVAAMRERPLRWWAVASVAFGVPIALVLGIQENWFQPEKMTISLVLAPVVAGFAAIGLGRIAAAGPLRGGAVLGGLVVGCGLVVGLGTASLRDVEFPEDPRFRQAYPVLRSEDPGFMAWIRDRWLDWGWTPMADAPGVLRALPGKSREALEVVAAPAYDRRVLSMRETYMNRAVPFWETLDGVAHERPPPAASSETRAFVLDLRESPTVAADPVKADGDRDVVPGSLLDLDLSGADTCMDGPAQGVRVPFSDRAGPVVACRASGSEAWVFVATSPAQPFPTDVDAYRSWLAGESPGQGVPTPDVEGLRLILPREVTRLTLIEVLFLGPARHYLRRVTLDPDGRIEAGRAEVWRHN